MQRVVLSVSGASREGQPTQAEVGKGSPKEMIPALNLGHISDNKAGGMGRSKGEVTLSRQEKKKCVLSRDSKQFNTARIAVPWVTKGGDTQVKPRRQE